MKKEYKAIAVQTLCNVGGIAILEINNEKVTSTFWNMDRYETKRTTNIFYNNNGDPYFVRYGIKYFLSDFIRI